MSPNKLEISFANGRGEALLDGQKISQCSGIDLRIRPGQPVEASIGVTVLALSLALDVEPAMISVRQKELDAAIEQIQTLLLIPTGVSPTEMLEDLQDSLRAIRAGLFSRMRPKPKT